MRPVARVDEDVAGMRVAVEEPVDEDLLDDRPDEQRAERGRVHAGRGDLVACARS